jgi:hypothetical protein
LAPSKEPFKLATRPFFNTVPFRIST